MSRPPARRGADLHACAQVLAAGGVAVVPTDTLYGLAASIADAAAVARVLAIKTRPSSHGMPVLLASPEQAEYVGEAALYLRELGAAYWPGGVTLVIPALPAVPAGVCDARRTVAVRVPGLELTRELARQAGAPLTGTSANRAGEPPPATVAQLHPAVGAAVDYILDGGRVGGRPSTIVDLTTSPPRVLRDGAVSLADLRRIVPGIVPLALGDTPRL
ncbi:MAG: threonylcarbamoyl-AMP synthase [Actinobacteria bacterium]|nr:threonylcarbamoyl-AMP synthase [Actinomycetota bacterium]